MYKTWQDRALETIKDLQLVKSFSVNITEWGAVLEIRTLYEDCEANRIIIGPYRNTQLYELQLFKGDYPHRSFKRMTTGDIQATLRLYCLPKI